MMSTAPSAGNPGQAHPAGKAPPMQVVMLGIGGETFALDAALVREIIDPIPTTRVAGARSYVPGVVNVRGNVVPLADISERFGLARRETTPDSRFVVIEIEIDGDPVVMALMADKVHEVTEIDTGNAQQMPRVGTRWKQDFIRQIVKWRGEFVIVPELERILN